MPSRIDIPRDFEEFFALLNKRVKRGQAGRKIAAIWMNCFEQS
jgi:hypothetical protein